MIAVKDIGKWVAHMFANPQQYLGQAVELAGDEVTFDQMISAYQKVYGKRLFSIKLPSGMFARGDAGKMITWISEHGYQADIRALRQAVPDMLTFEQFINEKRIL